MKKTPFVIMIGLLFITGIGTSIGQQTTTQTTTDIIPIAEPRFTAQDGLLTIAVDGSEAQMLDPGRPMLPIIAKTYEFPFGTRITGVTVDLTTFDYPLQHKITPTPAMIIKDSVHAAPKNIHPIDESIYQSTAWYPVVPYRIDQTVGLSHGVDLLTVAIQITPQYAPAQNLLRMPTAATVHITYLRPQNTQSTNDTYDLLIITDE
jgi:hypothetical protein